MADQPDRDTEKNPMWRDGTIDVNWLELAEFIRNVGSDYMQLLIRKKFNKQISLYDANERKRQKQMFVSKFKLRIILYHFIKMLDQYNNPNTPRVMAHQMFKRVCVVLWSCNPFYS